MSKAKVRFKNNGIEKARKDSQSSEITNQLNNMESEKQQLMLIIQEQEDFIKNIADKMSQILFSDLKTKYSDREIIDIGTQLLSSISDDEIDSLMKLNNFKNDDKENKSNNLHHSNLQSKDIYSLAVDGVQSRIWVNAVDKKLPGQSSIRILKHDMLAHICQILDVEKKSGADWRCLALRTGMDETFIKEASKDQRSSPTLKLLKQLANDPLFSVRLLHRHFISPQMKQFELARVLETHFDL